jgi:ribosome maturation factor RimP
VYIECLEGRGRLLPFSFAWGFGGARPSTRTGRFLRNRVMENRLKSGNTDLRSQIVDFAEKAIDQEDLFLVDVVVRGQKGSRVIDVYMDGDNGIELDQLAGISKQLAFLLETADIIRGRYHLNVSSPGVERAFRLRRQYARHVGQQLSLTVPGETDPSGVAERKPLEGKLVSCSEHGISLLIPGEKTVIIDYEEVSSAQIVLPW